MATEQEIQLQQALNNLLKEQQSLTEKIVDIQDKNFEIINESRSVFEKNQKLLLEQKKLEEDILTLERTRLSEVEKIIESAKNESKIAQENLNNIEAQIERAEELNEDVVERIDLLTEEINSSKEKEEIDELIIQKKQEEIKNLRESLLLTRKQIDELKASRDEQEAIQLAAIRQKNSTEIISKNVAGLGASLGLAASVNDTWLGKLQQSLDASVGIESSLMKYKAAFKDMLAPANLFASLISKMAQSTAYMVAQTDSALASFNQATGAGGRFNEQIIEIGNSNLEFGVSVQESTKAFEALHGNMSLFTTLSKDAQNKAATLATQMQGIGVSAETTATNLDLATQALGMTIDEAIASQRRLADLSEQLGIAPQKMAADFGAAIPALAAHGNSMESVFIDLTKQSKATGIEMQSLIGIAKQFDTFESAATAAGKLNAILGGGLLNSAELLAATEAERIAMLRESIEMSGRNFDSMNKFEKMAIASAAGITDMTEASKLFGSTSIEFTKMQKEQKTLQERAAASADIMKKLQLIVQAFAVLVGPIITAIHFLADGFLSLNNATGGYLAIILAAGTGILALTGKLGILFGWVTKFIPTFGNFGKAAGQAAEQTGKGFAAAISSVGKASREAAGPIIKLSLAVLAAGAGIGLAAGGIALLASQMKGMGNEAWALVAVVGILVGGMLGLTVGIIALAAVGAPAAPILIALGVAFLMMGSSIAIAAAGISLIILGMSSLVDSFSALFKIFIDGTPKLAETASGMFLIAGALTAMSFAGLGIVAIGGAFGVLTAGVVSLAAALALINTEELLAVADIANSINGITIDKSVAFKASMESLEGTVTALATVPPATMTNVTEFVRRISEVTAVVGAGAAGAAGPAGPAGLTTATTSAGSAGMSPSIGEREIVLKIGEREFARAVVNILNKEMKLNLVGN